MTKYFELAIYFVFIMLYLLVSSYIVKKMRFICIGIERLHILLRREGWKDSQKRVYRIYCEEGLNLRRKRNKRVKPSRSRVTTNGVTFTLHECRSMDFMSDALFDV